MKKRQTIAIYVLVLFGVFLVFANSCKKDDDDNNDTANTFTDSRDNTVYKTLTIGNQVWMEGNLKYLPGVAGPGTGSKTTPYYYVFGYDGTNVADAKAATNYITYGVLYNWEAAKAACPAGWHLPGDAEWTQLTDYLEGADGAGGKLKETGTTHWNNPNTGATNETGYKALPGGYRSSNGSFSDIGNYGFWWSATEQLTDYAWYRYMSYTHSNVNIIHSTKEFGLSVRCVRD
jgi:uncharacterized protein (TIGR02145 family)